MERKSESQELLEKIIYPAFVVKDGIISNANQAARLRGIETDMQISSLIETGAEAYAVFSDGKLCLTLNVCGITYNATVTPTGSGDLFCLESDYEAPELRALSLAAQQLREPLSNAMLGTDQLLPNANVQSDPQLRDQLAQINRNLHQLLRAVSNMSDTAQYKAGRCARMEACDAVGIFEEVLKKAAHLAERSGRTLNYSVPAQSVICFVDADQLERAILNLISNAIKYSPKESTIMAQLRRGANTLIFSIWDNGNVSQKRSDLFSAYLQEPGLTDGRSGIGLGMTIVRAVAAAHGGTVLMEQPKDSGIKITMTICAKCDKDTPLRSPISLPFDYAGGRDHALVELSDALSDSLYNETF